MGNKHQPECCDGFLEFLWCVFFQALVCTSSKWQEVEEVLERNAPARSSDWSPGVRLRISKRQSHAALNRVQIAHHFCF